MTLAAGDSIAGYTISGPIGSGGMATVYRATDRRLQRQVAIKLLHPTFMQDEDFRARFQREARIIARLEHPHIVPIYDYAEHEGLPFFVMKLIEGGTLKRRLIKRGVTLADMLRLMRPVAAALAYAHEQGVLHRDIKPSNILLDQREHPYLSDFGLARIAQLSDATISHDLMLGTPHYISPEQAKGQRELTPATDVYSFAIIVYELLTGAPPFSGDTPFAIVHEQIYSPPPPPSLRNPALTADVDAVLLRALAKLPAQRYQSATALMADLERALKRSPVTDMPGQSGRLTTATRDERPPALTREDFVDEAEQIRDLALAMRKKVRASKAKRKAKDSAPEAEIRQRVVRKFRARRRLLLHALVYVAVFGAAALNLMLGVGGGPSGILDLLAPAQLWGVALALHGIRYTFGHGPGATARDAEIERQLGLEGERIGENPGAESDIRRRITDKYKARRAIAMHAAVFLLFALPMFLFDLFGPSRADQLGFVMFWAALLGGQCWRYYHRHGRGAARHEAEIEGEITRQLRLSQARRRRLSDEDDISGVKGRKVRLTNEGELTDSFVDEAARVESRERHK